MTTATQSFATDRGSGSRLLWLPIAACAADVTLTLVGQPAAYWCGNHSAVEEFNPAARWLLAIHPMLFVIAAMVTSGMVAAAVLFGRRPLAIGVSLLVTIGHTIAACAWLAKSGVVGWVAAIALMLLVRWALTSRGTVFPACDRGTPH